MLQRGGWKPLGLTSDPLDAVYLVYNIYLVGRWNTLIPSKAGKHHFLTDRILNFTASISLTSSLLSRLCSFWPLTRRLQLLIHFSTTSDPSSLSVSVPTSPRASCDTQIPVTFLSGAPLALHLPVLPFSFSNRNIWCLVKVRQVSPFFRKIGNELQSDCQKEAKALWVLFVCLKDFCK